MKNNLLPIAKEGWNYIAFSVALFVVSYILHLEFLQLFSFVLLLFFLFVFRNPERELPNFEENSVLCPVDGEVTSIDALENSEFAYKVTINTTYKDVAVLRTPMNAMIALLEKNNGTRLSLDDALARKTNENVNVIFQDTNENKMKVSHIVKRSLCGIEVESIKEGLNVVKSSRYGIMVNGITELYLPSNFRLSLILGEETKASESLVGYFS